MSKLLITTQVYENYGDAAQPYWKPKGGGDYVVKNFEGGNTARTTAVMMAAKAQIERYDDYIRESIIDFRVVADDYLTEFERDQLEYEGVIRFPAKELVW